MRKKIVIGLIIFIVVIGGMLVFFQQQKPLQVEGYIIGTGSYEELVSAIGYVEYDTESTVQVEVAGKIKVFDIKEGDRLDQGQLIVQIDDKDAIKTYQNLETTVSLTQSRYNDYASTYSVSLANTQEQKKAKALEIEGYELSLWQIEEKIIKTQELFDAGVVALSELEALENERKKVQNNINVARASLDSINSPAYASQELKTSVEAARLNLQQQEDELDKYSVYSPYDAIVLESYVHMSDVVQTAQNIVRIGSADKKVVWVDIDEKYIGKIQLGQAATLTAEAYPQAQYLGEIVEFSTSINRDTGTIGVKVEIREEHDIFIRNMSVKVDVATVQYEDVVLIPGNYIDSTEGVSVLMVNKEGIAYLEPISIQNQNKKFVYVLDGLKVGDIVIDPTRAKPGDAVTIEKSITDIGKRDDE